MRTCRGLTGSFARRRLHASAAAPGGEQVTVASAAPSIADAPAAVLALPRVVMAPRDGAAVAEAQRALIAEQLPSRAYFMAANARHEAGAAAAAAGSRSWERQMARTLLLLRAPEPVDLANPARWSRITYADIATALEGASHSGGSEQTDSAARGATSSGTSRPADVSTDDGFARVAREADAVDDSAARDSARLLDQIVGVLNAAGTPQPQEGTAPSSSTAASSSSGDAPPTATSQSSSAAAVAAKSAGRAPNGVDASPPVTGALPATSPIALMWLQAAEAHIAQVAARLRRYATAASGVPLATASSAAFSPSDVAVANRLLAAFSSVPLQPASEADAAWLRSLAPPSLRAFMSLLLLHRRGLAVPVPTTSGGGGAVLPHMDLLHARLARVDAVAVALRRIREAATATATSNAGANPSPPPTLRSLHGALADAVGDGVPVFTVLRSAAAAAAARFNARLAAEQRRLDDAVAQARRVREGFLGADRKGEAEAASAAVGFDIVGSTPSSSAAVVVSRATGKTVGSLALEDGDGLAARLDQGHLPSALAPLAAILTPAEMAALHTLVAAATPSGIDSLPHPAPGGDVGSRPSNAAVDDVIDDVVTSKSARRLLGVEAAVSDALREALDSLALSGDAGAATSPLPAGFDVAGWRMYITAALEAAAAAGPSAGGERALTSMVRAAAAALPDDLRSIAARAGAGGDPLRSFADRVGISYDDLDAAAADSSIAVAALAADEVDVRAAAGDSISSRDTVPLPLDASAALSSSLVAGVDVIAAGGGGTTPLGGAPRPNQYYPVTQAMVAPDGSVVHVPVVSRLPADFTGTADDGSAPPSPAVADAADAFFDELAAAAGAAAEGDIAGALRAQRAAAARARAERAAEASGGGGGGSASEAEDGDAPAVDDGGAAGPSGRRRALSTTETLRLAQRASAAAERADRADAGENGSSFASGSASFIADIDRPVGAGGVPQPRSMSAGLVVGERDPRRISRYGRIRRIRADTSTLELMRRGAAEGRPVAELEAEATPWTEKVVVAAEGYRAAGSGGAYTLLHERLLEAADAADLEAMFALWFEHCRLTPQVRARSACVGLSRASLGSRLYDFRCPITMRRSPCNGSPFAGGRARLPRL